MVEIWRKYLARRVCKGHGQLEAPQSRRSQDGGDMAKAFSASRLQSRWVS